MPPDQPRRFVRQFALTQGRVRSIGRDLPLDTLVKVTALGRAESLRLPREQADVAILADRPISVAEIAAHLHVHLGIARVIVSDMVAGGLAEVSVSEFDESGPDLVTLERLLDDLQAL